VHGIGFFYGDAALNTLSKPSRIQNTKGVTLPELMIATFILVIVFSSAIITFLRCLELNELARNSSLAITAGQNWMTDIENTPFDNVYATYHLVTFSDADINGIGVSYIDDSDPDLLKVTITFSWRQANGRVVGEDANLNGAINTGEDVNNNGILDSPVTFISYLVNV
jgi:prepilin-type N-terminal cleavage/methylation domain-containing protein